MLADPEFRKAIDRDPDRDRDQARLEAAAERIAAALDLPQCRGLRVRLARELAGGVSDAPRSLADALLARDLEPTLEALHAAFSAAGAGDEGVRAAVVEVLGELLPTCYEPGDLAGTAARIDAPGVYCVELPAGLATAGEIILAGVRARPVRFHPLADRDGFPEPLDRLPSPPETGFDRHGRAYLGNLETDLANKLASPSRAYFETDYTPDLESYLGHRFASDEERRVRADAAKRAQMRGIVQDELERHARAKRFFYILFDAETEPLAGPAAAALQTLKGRYPLLDFAVLTQADDLAVRRRERRRLSRLRDLLPVKP